MASLWAGEVEPRQVEPDPRPAKRQKASQGETAALKAHFAHACCVNCGLPYTHRHHIAFRRADNGDDIPANIAPLCTACHDLLHSRGSGWERVAAAIRVYVLTSRDRCVYMKSKMSWDRFNARYPLLSEPKAGNAGSPAPRGLGSESDWDRYEEPVWRYRPPEDRPPDFGSENETGFEHVA